MILINIGDELLIGQVVNTNAAFIGQRMMEAGIELTEIQTVGDEANAIREAVVTALAKTNIVILTGGLGPTKDDITKKVICDLFHRSLMMDEATLQFVTGLFESRGLPMTEVNRRQAMVPEGCTVLHNPLGTAPGMWLEDKDKILIALPGVPYEMSKLITDEVIPRLQKRLPGRHTILYKVLQCTDITESNLSDLLTDYEAQLPPELKLAYLPKPGIIRLRLTGRSDDPAALTAVMDAQFDKLKVITKNYYFTDKDINMEAVVGELLVKAGKRMATAESCTGGHIAHLITSVPGSSHYFKGSIVSYDNDVKRELLNVRVDNLKRHGAVSEEVVSDMALNAMNLFDVDYTIAVSGIAGPDGGSKDKPVGTVWIAVATPVRLKTQLFHFGINTGRLQIIERAAHAALNMLRVEIEKDL